MRLLEEWDGQPTWLRRIEGVVIVVAIFVALNVVTLLTGTDSAVPDVLFWLVLLALFVLSAWIGDVRLGGHGQARLLRRSMRRGLVADGADRASWRREIARRRSFRGRARRTGRRVAVIFPAVAVALFVLAVAADGWITALTAMVPIVVLAPIIGYLLLVSVPRARRRLDILEAKLATDD